MSFATEKEKLATERFLLVRLTPARFVTPTFVSGTTYTQTFSYPIARVERNGVALTLVTALSGNDQYTYNESTSTMQVRLAGAPNDTTNVIVIYYYLFYTGTKFRTVYEDPEDDSTTVREWQPKLKNYPEVEQSFDNIRQGVFTISDTNLQIINTAGEFQEYLSDDDSFYNKAVDIWLCINSATNIQKIFTGSVTRIVTNQNSVSIDVVDSFNKLKQPAYMGDSADESIFRRDSGSFPTLNPRDNDRPCPYIVGSSSRYQTKSKTGTPALSTTAYELAIATPAVCTDYSSTVSTSNNRTWGACRLKGSVSTQAFGSIQAAADVGTDFVFARLASISNVAIGDTIKWTEAAVVHYGTVHYVGAFTYSATSYNIVFGATAGTFTTSSTITNQKSFGLIIDAPDETLTYLSPMYGRDYTISETTTSGSNKFVSIVFGNNFEANFAGYTALQPDAHVVSFRTSNSTVQKHGDILKEVMGKVGLSVNAGTFTAADSALAVPCRFHIPNFDEDSADTYLKYCQDVLSSTLGYISVNPLFEVEYHLLEAPTSTDVRDSFLMLDGNSSCVVDYQDIATKIIAYNPHNDSGDAIQAVNTPAATAESTKARWLHGIVNVNRFRHVLEEMSTKIDDHISLKSRRSAVYSFCTATQDIDTELGDDLQLDNKIVLGSSNIQDVKVTTITKSPNRISLKASDLKGL